MLINRPNIYKIGINKRLFINQKHATFHKTASTLLHKDRVI